MCQHIITKKNLTFSKGHFKQKQVPIECPTSVCCVWTHCYPNLRDTSRCVWRLLLKNKFHVSLTFKHLMRILKGFSFGRSEQNTSVTNERPKATVIAIAQRKSDADFKAVNQING